MKFRLQISILIFCMLTGIQADAQSSLAPFLYYYSSEDGAFIMERADGTESSVLVDYPLDENQFLWGAGWSVSGEWFAWSNGSIKENYLEYSFSIYITDRAGNQKQFYPDKQVLDMQWSPNEDKLLVKFFDEEQDNGVTIHIIDIASQEVIFSTDAIEFGIGDFRDNSYLASHINATWIDSGYFVVYYPNAIPNDQQRTMQVFTSSGDFVAESIYNNNLNLPFWSHNGYVLYSSAENESLILENILLKEIVEFEISFVDIIQVDWHPNGSDALIYANSNTIWSTSLYFLSVENQTLSLISEISRPIHHFYDGTQREYSKTSWTVDGTRAYFIEDSPELNDYSNSILIFEHSTQLVQSAYSNSNRIYDAEWLQSGEVLLFSTDNRLMEYSRDTGQISTVFPQINRIQNFSISPDDRFIGYSQAIIDFSTNEIVTGTFEILQLEGLAYPEYYGWYSDGDNSWVLLSSRYIHTFGFVGVNNVSGTVSRSLVSTTFCLLNSVCYGWLPELINE